jgi:hypothetical protein
MLRKGILKGCDNSNSIRLSAFFVIIHVTLRFSKELERYSPSYIHAYGMAKLALDHYKWFQSTGLHYVPFYSCLSQKGLTIRKMSDHHYEHCRRAQF